MKQVLVKKENGILLDPVIVDRTTRRFYPYITENENCFANALDLKSIAKNNSDVIDPIVKNIDMIIKNYLLVEHYGYEFIKKLFMSIKLSHTKEDLLHMANLFIGELNRIIIKAGSRDSIKLQIAKSLQTKFQQHMSGNSDLTLALLIKRIIYTYYRIKINTLDSLRRENLELLKNSGETPEIMLAFIGESFYESEKKNGTYALAASVLEQVLENLLAEEKTHLCWKDCANARANLCPRIADIEAKRLDQYDIITDGYQTFNSNGKMINFYVTGCKLYRKQARKELTTEQKRKMTERKAALKMYYYDADTLEIADHEEQRAQVKKMQLKNPRNPQK